MSKIEWTEETWNPTTGCNKVSQGCKNCYAEKMHKRLQAMGQAKYQQDFLKGVVTHESELNYPLTIKKPTIFFVNSMSDLFHKDVPFGFIYDVFRVMQEAHWHTFQVLTKRAETMEEFCNRYAEMNDPLPNVWLGVSCEDQATADERIPYLLKTPAAVRFLSCEPLLGLINLYAVDSREHSLQSNFIDCLRGRYVSIDHKGKQVSTGTNKIDWVIVGGESGHRARPMHPSWIESIQYQCYASVTPFFFKQWGEYIPLREIGGTFDINRTKDVEGTLMYRIGKDRAGARLNGREYREFPKLNHTTHA